MQAQSERSEAVRDVLTKVLDLLGVEGRVDAEETPEQISVNITGEDTNILIGARGHTLNALQQIANVVANKGREEWLRVVVDAEGYRERRRQTLEEYAHRLADEAVAEGETTELEPMNSFERRIVHCALADRGDVRTESRGEEPDRYIVIVPEGAPPA